MRRQLVDELGAVRFRPPSLPIYSTVAGDRAEGMRFDAAYLGRNVREPVRFADAIGAMVRDGCDVVVEIGPHPVLSNSIAEICADREGAPTILGSLRRGKSDRESLLQTCADAYAAGCIPNWKAVQPATGCVTTLPPYAWQRKAYWLRARPVRAEPSPGKERGHPLLGNHRRVAGSDAYVFDIDPGAAAAWLSDHRIFGRILMPAAVVMETMLAAARNIGGWARPQLTAFVMHRPLLLPEAGQPASLGQMNVAPTQSGSVEIGWYEAIEANGSGQHDWRLVASGEATPGSGSWAPIAEIPSGEPVAPAAVYDLYRKLGVEFGPAFRRLTAIAWVDNSAQAQVALPSSLEQDGRAYPLHPVLIDAGLQLCTVVAQARKSCTPPQLFLPIGADRFEVFSTSEGPLVAAARMREGAGAASRVVDISFKTAAGDLAAIIEGMRFVPADAASLAAGRASDDAGDLYDIGWERAPALSLQAEVDAPGEWLVFEDRSGVAAAISATIETSGGRCAHVQQGDHFARMASRRWVIDPAQPDHYLRLLSDIGPQLCGVIHCWSIDIPTVTGAPSVTEFDHLRGAGSALHLMQALAHMPPQAGGSGLFLLTKGSQTVDGREPATSLCPRGASVWGLASVAALEHPELRVRMLDLDPSEREIQTKALMSELRRGTEPRVALRGRERWVPRLRRYRAAQPIGSPRRITRLMSVKPGTIDSLDLIGIPRPQLGDDEVRLRVLAAGVNFRDVLSTLGMYPGEVAALGCECVGVVEEVGSKDGDLRRGERVFGFAPGSFGTEVNVPAAFLTRAPAQMSDEEAASIPVAFLTALYGLSMLAKLRSGERVLIHAATGGVGLAAVQIAGRLGAQVFATAGSEAKRDYLRSLGVEHVMDSRTLSFAEEILEATGGAGVDVVLNSLAGEFIPASLRALSTRGRFLELGKRGVWTPEAVASVRPSATYFVYDLGSEAHANRALLRPMYDDILAAMAEGEFQPLPVTTFNLSDSRQAFRLMAQARHVGKLVLRVGASGRDTPFACPEHATYWITGGLGAVGLETLRWLVRKGARHVVLTGRHPPSRAARATITELEQQGVSIRILQADAGDRAAMEAVLKEIRCEMPPLRGVVHAAGVLSDATLLNQRWSDARIVFRGKVGGAWLLHELTRDVPLDFLIFYSAAGLVLGAAGQAVYAAANAELDALARARRALGLPALSVAWGLWKGGLATQHDKRGLDTWLNRGLREVDSTIGFAHVERLLADGAAYGAVLPIDWSRFLSQLPVGVDRDFFAPAIPPASTMQNTTPSTVRASNNLDRVRALPGARRRGALTSYLTEHVLSVLNLDPSTPVDAGAALKDLGLDSLMAVELRNVLARSGGKPLPATLLFDFPTLAGLTSHLLRVWELEEEITTDATVRSRSTLNAEIAGLSEAAAEALLLEELERSAVGET